MSKLDQVVEAGDIIYNLFDGNSYVIIVDRDGTIVRTWDVPHLPFDLKVGTPIPEGTITYQALKGKKRLSTVMNKEESRFGFGYVGIGLPFFEEDGSIAGSMTVTSPMQQQDLVRDISRELNMEINHTNETKDGILGISSEMADTIGNLTNIADAVKENMSVMTDVISLIDDVAYRTNFLGINASIEAARSGEQGKSFAVVAQEIRKLSEMAKNSVHELKSKLALLNEVIGGINPQVSNLNDFVSKHSTLIEETEKVIRKLAASSKQLEHIANESWL